MRIATRSYSKNSQGTALSRLAKQRLSHQSELEASRQRSQALREQQEQFKELSTESLLTTRIGFNVDTASNVQRARCRIGDGLPLDELANDPDVASLCGGLAAIALLPSEQHIAPKYFIDVSAIRTCKTMMAVARGIRATQIVDVAVMKVGETARLVIVSLKEDRALVTFGMAKQLMLGLPELKSLLLDEPTSDSMLIRHPSGKPIRVTCTVLAKAGASMVSDWCAGFIADEAPRMIGRGDGVANLDDSITAVTGRMLPRAQIQLLGSPWAPTGPVYELVQEHFGKPSESFVVLRSTGPMNWPQHFTPEECDRLRKEDPLAFTTDVLGEFADPETGWLDPRIVREHTRLDADDIPAQLGHRYVAALDTSGGQTGANPHSLVVVELILEYGITRYEVVSAQEWRGMSIGDIWLAVASAIKPYRIETLWIDQWAGPQNVELARNVGINTASIAWVGGESSSSETLSKVEAFTDVATLIHSGRVTLHPHKLLQRDLLSVVKRPKSNGYEIVLPKTRDGRHCDFAPALVMCIAKATADKPINWGEFDRMRAMQPKWSY